MSQKRVKRERKLLRVMLTALEPIVDSAMIELDDDEEMFGKWISIAFTAHCLEPEIPLEELLPNRLDQTLDKIRGQNFRTNVMNDLNAVSIEDTP